MNVLYIVYCLSTLWFFFQHSSSAKPAKIQLVKCYSKRHPNISNIGCTFLPNNVLDIIASVFKNMSFITSKSRLGVLTKASIHTYNTFRNCIVICLASFKNALTPFGIILHSSCHMYLKSQGISCNVSSVHISLSFCTVLGFQFCFFIWGIFLTVRVIFWV